MLTFWDRRQFLRLGGLGLAGLTLADLLRQEARGTKPAARSRASPAPGSY